MLYGKINMAKKGYKQTEAHREKSKIARLGSHHSEESIQRMRVSQKGNTNGKGSKGRKHSDETKEKISLANMGNTNAKGHKCSDEAIEKMSLAKRGKSHPSHMLGKKHSAEARNKISISMKAFLSQEENYARLLKQLSQIQSPTFIENKLFAWICTVFSTEDIYRNYHIGKYYPDFAIPELKICFEADGSYWHSLPGRKESDIQKDLYFIEQGWEIYRFSEEYINQL